MNKQMVIVCKFYVRVTQNTLGWPSRGDCVGAESPRARVNEIENGWEGCCWQGERGEELVMLGNDCTPFSEPGACVGGREQTEMRQKR